MKKFCSRLILAAVSIWMVSVSATLEDAQTLYEQGRNTEALAEVERVLAMRPKDAEARFLKGIIYAESGDSSGAIEVFAGLTQDFPELPEPWNNLAVLFAENGEFDKARESLLAAIQTHPSYSTAHENLGDLYARMAGMAYDRALEQDRGNESARLKLSAVNGLFAAPRIPSSDPQPAATVAAATPPPVQQPTATEPPPQAASSTVPPPAVETEPEVSTPEPAPTPVVAATTTAPAPVSQTPPPAVEDASEDLVAAVRNWAAAWSGQNVDQYLASYSPNFTPSNGASYRAWASYRRERLTKPKVIEVELSDIQVEQIDENTATVSFGQKYRSDNYRDEVTKTLTFNKANGSWRIVAEVSE